MRHLPPLTPLALSLLMAGFGCTQSSSTDSSSEPRNDRGSASSVIATDRIAKESNPEELVQQALKAMSEDEAERALALVNLALSKEPKHREGMMLKGALLYGEAQKVTSTDRTAGAPLLSEAAEAMRALRAEYPELRPQEQNLLIYTLYDEARGLVVLGQPEEAVAVLADAVESGLDVPAALDNDKLASLADREDFKALQETLKRKSTEKLKAQIAEFEPFPFEFELPTLAGETATLDQLKGKALTIVDIWGTWCPPCRREIPHFIELYEQFKEEGLEIVGVTYEQTQDVQAACNSIEAFLKEMPIPYPLVITDGGIIEEIPGFQGFPTTLFVDAEGQVRLKLVGEHSKEDLELIITSLMAAEPANSTEE